MQVVDDLDREVVAAGDVEVRLVSRNCSLELDDQDKAILDFEALVWKHAGAKDGEILHKFGMKPTTYYLRVNQLLDAQAALAYAPTTVKRLRRLRDKRRDARNQLVPRARAYAEHHGASDQAHCDRDTACARDDEAGCAEAGVVRGGADQESDSGENDAHRDDAHEISHAPTVPARGSVSDPMADTMADIRPC